jgi:RHS repeat-associated protein
MWSNLSAKASAEADENATLADVYFDDVTMTHTKGNVIQYNEYYPFGMQTANSWTRENTTGNNFLANGGTELNTTSNLYDLAYRHYDPVLGRMNGVDPMAVAYGSVLPYNYSFNDPVSLNDPSGADPYASYGDGFDPVLEQYTGYMYSSNYGWLQDDNIHHRIIGWRAPVAQYAGTLALPQNQRGMMGGGLNAGWSPGQGSLSSYYSGSPRRNDNITIDWSQLADGNYYFGFNDHGGLDDFYHLTVQSNSSAYGTSYFWQDVYGYSELIRSVGYESYQSYSQTASRADDGIIPGIPGSFYGYLRHLSGPDAIGISGNIDFAMPMGGFDVSPLGAILILRGPEAGSVVPVFDFSLVQGIDISAAIKFTNFYFSGPENDIKQGTFLGFRIEANIAVTSGIDLGASFGWAPNVNADSFFGAFRNAVYAESFSIGVGIPAPFPVSGNWNLGYTFDWRDITNLLGK